MNLIFVKIIFEKVLHSFILIKSSCIELLEIKQN